ncbi:MAG: phospholipase D-like domain-containing protein [Aggregatilineales bacterium]
MTRRDTPRPQRPVSPLGVIVAAVVVVLALLISRLTGVSVEELLGLPSPTPTAVQVVAPTAAPSTPAANVTSTPLPPVEVALGPGGLETLSFQQGYGARKGFWQVYFTAPTGSRNPADYVGGVDTALVAAISGVQRTLDIAAFEWNNPNLHQAVLDAHRRGVRVRIVTDNEHGLKDEDSKMNQLIAAGIPVVDDGRTALMHNKFMILDGAEVWTGSMNYTINDTFRNNNNMLVLRARRAVDAYQAEFNEKFEDRAFGPRSPRGNAASFTQDGVPVEIHFAPEDDVLGRILDHVSRARSSVRLMAFSFTVNDIADELLRRAQAGVSVRGIYETVGSQTAASTLTQLFCAGQQVRQDGNPFVLHHKVFIVDERTVITGSFNFSANATRSNDENLVIITDADLAAQYIAEFERRWAEARVPTALTCQ